MSPRHGRWLRAGLPLTGALLLALTTSRVAEGQTSRGAPQAGDSTDRSGATYDDAHGAVIRGDAGTWTFRPSAMIALRQETESTTDGAIANNGFRLQATRLVMDARQERWKVQFHYQFHSDEGHLATGIVFVRWAPRPFFNLLVGQTRVPFNREHLTGFFYHQAIDRSVVNTRFGLSRDLGVAAQLSTPDHRWEATFGLWNGARAAAVNDNQSYLTTARFVFQPNGAIPYEEADLAPSARPRVSFALAVASNPARTWQPGTDGKTTTWTDIRQVVLEHTLRFRGVSVSSELHLRESQRPDGPRRDFGTLLQLGVFVVPRRFERVGRTARIGADKYTPGEERGEHLVGANLYLNGHRFKLQADAAALPRDARATERRVRLQTMMVF
jgi:hypothetical protein